ncbi:Tetratricopeptide repeat protein [Roseovarius litorisediminis]|uniref:Tetratricopeptide repeat protein n=1 Tax=Roseovarius litorisediminis TaxID=1312363 RepID=A0A1Y5S9Z0_9RHOB|nr:tetratricopeptide repeat protein [Roseovarius litorisediminis]SLN34321.1 Tetratricopeptide repeat protein [Roseovarius litorisediminis]
MSAVFRKLNNIVTALAAIVMFSLPALAVEEAKLDRLFLSLKDADATEAGIIAKEIELELSKSGSPAMDLLLKRGRDALEAGDSRGAIGHFTALTDHAPDFAEGWNARSIAFFQAELYGPALADIERTLALQPRNFNAIYGLGVILEEINRPNLAREAYNRVLAIHPHHKDVTAALERLNGQLGGSDL